MAEAVDLNPTKCQFESDYGYMGDCIVNLKKKNSKQSDLDFVTRVMTLMMTRHPDIEHYTYETLPDGRVQVFMWGKNFHITDS